MPLPESSESAKARPQTGPPSIDAGVTPAQIYASLRTLARQIAILIRTAIRDAGLRLQIWWKRWRASARTAGSSLADRWPGMKAGLSASTSRFTPWRGRVGSMTWRNARLPKLPAKYFLAFIALGLAAFIGLVLYSIATLPITGGLQVEATQSALTFEGSEGEVFAARGVLKGDRLTAADMPPHLAQAIVAIEDRRFYEHHGVDIGEYCVRAGGIPRPAARVRAAAPLPSNWHA